MLNVDRKTALAAAQKLKRCTIRRGIPVLEGIRIDDAGLGFGGPVFSATDLEVAGSWHIQGSGSSAPFIVPAVPLIEALKASTAAEVTFELEGPTVNVDGISLKVLPVQDWPILPASPGNVGARLEASDYRDLVARIEPATTSDDSRPVLTGIYLEVDPIGAPPIRATATDSYRLHHLEVDGWAPSLWAAVVPGRALKLTASWLGTRPAGGLELEHDGSHVWIRHGSWVLSSRIIEGEFPNYRQLMPEPVTGRPLEGRWTPSGSQLAEVLAGAVGFIGREATPMGLRLEAGCSAVAVVNRPEVGRFARSVDGSYDGPTAMFGVNPGYMAAALAAAGPGAWLEVRIPDGSRPDEAGAVLKPIVVRTADGTFTGLVMPVRGAVDVGATPARVEVA